MSLKMRTKRKRSVRKKKTAAQGFPKKKLYEALLRLHNFRQWEDFSLLNSKYFLNLCKVEQINWDLSCPNLKTTPPKAPEGYPDSSKTKALEGCPDSNKISPKTLEGRPDLNKISPKTLEGRPDLNKIKSPKNYPDWSKALLKEPEGGSLWPFKFSSPLVCQTKHYGDLMFFSSQKFSSSQKSFLKKIALWLANTIYFIEQKEKMEIIKKQWGKAFDSFSQAFCITDQKLKIIRFNQAFQKISPTTKKDLFAKNLDKIFPFSLGLPKQIEKSGSQLVKGEREGEKIYLEISFKPLFLNKEKVQVLLFLIKEVTEEIKIEKKLSAQAKDRELGLIKGSLAHELNNPIAGVKALLNILEKQPLASKTLKDSLQEMQKSISVCHKIVQNMLSISQSSNQKLKMGHKLHIK